MRIAALRSITAASRDLFFETEGVKGVQMRNVNANWLNAAENIVDISHLAWLHGYTFPAYGAKKITYHWDRKDYGIDNVLLIDGVVWPLNSVCLNLGFLE